jgi:hypothetical protein
MAAAKCSIPHGLLCRACVLLLLISLCIFSKNTQSKPPPGFEDLLEPQTTLVDIYFGKRFIGNSLATYRPETVELQDPSGVVALIPNVKDVQLVEDALTGPLANNGDKICLSEVERNCGTLEPNVADVIFDEGRFQLQIFINQLHLEKLQIVVDKFLPPSESNFSTVNLFSTSLSGNDNDNAYSLGASHLASLKESRLQLQWDYSDVRDLNIESLSAQRDWAGKAAEIGLFDSTTRNSSFFTQADLLGIRAYSSTDTRTDLEYQDSTEIFLFFSSPTLVEVFKDDNLVVVEEYEAGNQQLDTSQFPSGSYLVTLKLTDAQGNVREEEYFFVKSSLLPPRDQPLHFFEVGQIKESNPDTLWPDSVGESLLRFGTAYRLTDNLGTELEFLSGDGREIFQGGLLYFGSGYYLQGSLMSSSKSDWGLHLRSQINRKSFSLNFDYRELSSNNDREIDDEFSLIPNSFRQGSVSAGIPLDKGAVYLRARINERDRQDQSESFGIEYRRPLFRHNHINVDLTADTVYQDGDVSFRTGLTFNRISKGVNLRNQTRYVHQEQNGSTEQDFELSASADYSAENTSVGRYSAGIFADELIDRRSLGARFNNQSTLGRSNFRIEEIDSQTTGNLTRYFGNAKFNALSDESELAVGGQQLTRAGVIIDLQSDLEDTPFEIYVDRKPAGYAHAGRKTVLSLRPYDTYEIQIRPRGVNLVHFDDTARLITLYPGNVETLAWEINAITILISNAIDEVGNPISNAKFENLQSYGSTDDNGWFQIEISNREPLIVSKQGTPICQINLPEFEAEQGIAVLDEVVCKPIQGSPTNQEQPNNDPQVPLKYSTQESPTTDLQ